MKKLTLFILIAAFGCSSDSDLSDSVFIPDNEYYELPAYTEWGYNTFGAHYDRSVFIYSDSKVPLKVTVEQNKLVFIFQGEEGRYSGDYMSMRFILPDSNVVSYQDLLAYNDTIIDLTDENIVVEMYSYDYDGVLEVLSGELNFNRSQELYVDDEVAEIVLSGYFNLKFVMNNTPSEMSDGRFDFGVADANFFNYE